MPVLVSSLKDDSKLLSCVTTLCKTNHWSTIWNLRNMRSCTLCGIGKERKESKCPVLLPTQLMDLLKRQKGKCASCTEPLTLPLDQKTLSTEVTTAYNVFHPKIDRSSECTSSSNVSHLLCGICHNLWNTTFGDRTEFKKYREVLLSNQDDATIQGISYRPTLAPGTKVYIPPKIKKVGPFRTQWDIQQGCGALLLAGDTKLTIFKVPLSTNSNHLLAVRAIPRTGEELSETNFILIPDIFTFLQGVYTRESFLTWAGKHMARGAPPRDHFKTGIPVAPTSEERNAIIQYGQLYHDIKSVEKAYLEKKKELKQLEAEVQKQAQKYGDHEKSLQLREHQLLFSMKRKEGTPNPITEAYIKEMLPYALLQNRIITQDTFQRISSGVWGKVVETLYDSNLRGRRPTSRSLSVKPLLVQQNTFEI